MSLRVYTEAQETIFNAQEHCDLSAYRFQLNRIYHVAVLGELPPDDLKRAFEQLLALGEPASIPQAVRMYLVERRAQAARLGPWVEGHYRP